MYRIRKYAIAAAVALFTTVFSNAQELEPQEHAFSVGIENTRHIYGQFTLKEHYTAKLNVSAYSEKIGYQYARATVGYKTSISMLNVAGECFFGSTLNGYYYNTGAIVSADAIFVKRLLLDAKIAPWYDSGYGYTTCYEAKIGCKITKSINIKVGYTNMPEYRMSEQRILAGFDFDVAQLSVYPYLSIGTKSGDGGKNIRVNFGFSYRF